MKESLLLAALVIMLMNSCVKESGPAIDDPPGFEAAEGTGVFVMNEGNFLQGNGSLSFYSYDSLEIFNQVFSSVNQRPLGDVPYSMQISGGRGYIIVNNSGKMEIVDINSLISVSTIFNLISPRFISFVSGQKAYISSLYSDSLTVFNTISGEITGFINIGHTSEALATLSTKTYAANWVGGHRLLVIDNVNDRVVDTVEVSKEPESMVIDRNGFLWVLCSGEWALTDNGWEKISRAELYCINTRTDEVEKKFVFPSISDSPFCLQTDGSGEDLYFLHQGVRKMNINDAELPDIPIIAESGRSFYRIGVNPDNSEIFISDAVDYQQRGFILIYDRNGQFISEERAGIIPGGFCFKKAEQ